MAIIVLGAIVAPIVLSLTFNSYGPLTEESAIRMAFATVAGQVLAILSGLVAVGVAMKRRYTVPRITILVMVAIAVAIGGFAVMASAGDLLLSRLDRIAEVDLLNR